MKCKPKQAFLNRLMGICSSMEENHHHHHHHQSITKPSDNRQPRHPQQSKSMITQSSNRRQQQQQHQSMSKHSDNEGNGNSVCESKCERQESVGVRTTSATASPSNLPPKNLHELRQNSGFSNLDIFTYVEMTLATKYFRPDFILGEGGFGVVYKGVIDESVRPGYQTTNVAIKELNRGGFQGDREWLTEVNYLGQLSHSNLVKLIGYCCEDEHRILVYEYMASGSLEKHLLRRVGCTLTWSKRIKIALDAAKGLAFLHGAERPVIYRDFKTSNILLDADFNAKLSDFGLAKDGPMGDQTHVSTRVMGTYGYAAPEYVMTGHLTARSDVYGFGVVLLEMLLGRRVVDKGRRSPEQNLVEWARPILNHDKKVLRILDPRLEGQYSARNAIKMANLAHQCLSQNPKGRPLMNQVVELLETIITEAESHEEEDAVILYEAPKPREKRRSKTGYDGDREDEARQSSKPTNGRSKSEPPPENLVISASSSPTNIESD